MGNDDELPALKPYRQQASVYRTGNHICEASSSPLDMWARFPTISAANEYLYNEALGSVKRGRQCTDWVVISKNVLLF